MILTNIDPLYSNTRKYREQKDLTHHKKQVHSDTVETCEICGATYKVNLRDQVQLAVSKVHWWGKQYGIFVSAVTTLANRVKNHLTPSA